MYSVQQKHFIASTSICIPREVQLTGTVSSSGVIVTGTGTLFTTQILQTGTTMLRNKYLFSPANGQVIEIIKVLSNTSLMLAAPFTTPLSGENVYVPDISYNMYSVSLNPLGAGVTVANVNEAASELDISAPVGYDNENGVTPIAVNATASDCEITIL